MMWWPLVFRPGQVRSEIWEANIEPLSIWRREAGCQAGRQSGFFCSHKLIFARMMQGWCYKHMLGKCKQREVKLESKTKTTKHGHHGTMKQPKRHLITLMYRTSLKEVICVYQFHFTAQWMSGCHSGPSLWRIPNIYWPGSKTTL